MNKIYSFIKSSLGTYKKSILTVENKNLTSTSKVFLFIFIIIVFLIIGKGVDMQQSYIIKPQQDFSYQCINLINKNKEINKFQNRDVSKDIYGTYYRHKYWNLESFVYNHQRKSEREVLLSFGRDSLCQELGEKYLDIAISDAFEDKLILKKGLKDKISSFNANIKRKTKEYSNTLLENIAKQDKQYSILSTNSKSIKKELKEIRKKLAILEKELSVVENITSLEEFQIFRKFLDDTSEKILLLRHEATKYYRLKYTINIFVFLFPAWLLFYLAYRVLKSKSFFITSHLSLNVANVAALYMIFNFFLLIYTIIPKVFLQKLIVFLSQYNLTLLLNITAILFFMLVFGFLIQRIQKKDYKDNNGVKNKALFEVRLKRKDTCVRCGNIHNEKDDYCGFCSYKLKINCVECKELIKSDYKFCPKCNNDVK